MEVLTIGQLAQAAEVHIETIRYYERRGLLREPPRTESGYRQYALSDLRRLQFIGRAKRLGFTLTEIAGLIGPASTNRVDSVSRIAVAKLEALDEQQRELAATRARLERLVDICRDPGSEDCTALRVAT